MALLCTSVRAFDLESISHRRKNILTNEWVLVSPHRAKRPWNGKTEKTVVSAGNEFEAGCYLCPGNKRCSGIKNDNYEDVFVFDNDCPALQAGVPDETFDEKGLLIAKGESGICRVIVFSPKHNLTLSQMSVNDISKVINVWQQQYRLLGSMPDINYVQIFENKGDIMGCSNPHPHCQVWAQSSVPEIPARKTRFMKEYFDRKKASILTDYLQIEQKKKERILYENKGFVVLVPFWAVWPYETMIVSKRHFQQIDQMSPEEVRDYAEAIKVLTACYDKLFECSFPYSAGIHQSPTDGQKHEEWHFHMSFYPPLLRNATVKKFMVGYEMLAEPQRDITPESAAAKLKALID